MKGSNNVKKSPQKCHRGVRAATAAPPPRHRRICRRSVSDLKAVQKVIHKRVGFLVHFGYTFVSRFEPILGSKQVQKVSQHWINYRIHDGPLQGTIFGSTKGQDEPNWIQKQIQVHYDEDYLGGSKHVFRIVFYRVSGPPDLPSKAQDSRQDSQESS